MKTRIQKSLLFAAILLLPALWIGSEMRYAARIRPNGIRTMSDHFQRFGEPGLVYEIQHDGGIFYEFTGLSRSAPSPWFALPSSPPAYIYDQSGRLVDWCPDPGDQPRHRQKWPRVSSAPLDIRTVGIPLSR